MTLDHWLIVQNKIFTSGSQHLLGIVPRWSVLHVALKSRLACPHYQPYIDWLAFSQTLQWSECSAREKNTAHFLCYPNLPSHTPLTLSTLVIINLRLSWLKEKLPQAFYADLDDLKKKLHSAFCTFVTRWRHYTVVMWILKTAIFNYCRAYNIIY